ncbi:MAG: protein kinase, partial [Pseudomonadota bacterium]
TTDPVTGETIAVKRLLHQDPASRARLQRELDALAALDHPGICRVIDSVEADGEAYLVMEFVDGVPLSEALGELNLQGRIELFEQITAAVSHAHEAGVIHRDLKPSNILVEALDGTPTIKIVDFGLARMDQGETLTVPGEVLGTPAFMAPEQAAGEPLDHRADIYALGALLYLMLTDRTTCTGSPAEAIAQAQAGRFPTPSQLRPAIPAPLEQICLRALGHAPSARYPSAAALLADLERFGSGSTVRAPGSWRWRAARQWRTRRGIILGTVVGSLALAGLAVAVLITEARGREQARLAAEFSRTSEDAAGRYRLVQMVAEQDLAPARAEVRATVDQIDATSTTMGPAAAEAAAFAAGRLAAQLDDWPEAERRLRDAGESDSVSYWRGLSQAAQFRVAARRVFRLRDEAQREALLAEARTRYRDPSLVNLRRTGETSDSTAALAAGLLAMTEERFAAARDRFTGVLDDDPWRFEAWVLMGESFEQEAGAHIIGGRWEPALALRAEAVDAYRSALAVAPSAGAAHRRLCEVQSDNVELASFYFPTRTEEMAALAQPACEAALRNDGESGQAGTLLAAIHLYRARTAMRGGLPYEPFLLNALATIEQALTREPELGEAWFRRANIHRFLSFAAMDDDRSPVEAVTGGRQAIARAIESDPENWRYLNTAANLELDLAEWQLSEGERAFEALDTAIAHLSLAAELSGNDPSPVTNLAIAQSIKVDALIDAGMPFSEGIEDALETYALAEAMGPNDSFVFNSRGVLLLHVAQASFKAGNDFMEPLSLAEADAQRAVELTPDDPLRHYNLGTVLRFSAAARRSSDLPWQETAEGATTALEASLALRPEDADTLIMLARIHLLHADAAVDGGEPATAALAEATALLDQVDRSDFKDLAVTRSELAVLLARTASNPCTAAPLAAITLPDPPLSYSDRWAQVSADVAALNCPGP